MLQKLFSFIIFLLNLLSNLFFLISIIGLSTTSSLRQYPWLKGTSNGSYLSIGTFSIGINAFYITGDDSDYIKYQDCQDLYDFCEECSSISNIVTFVMAGTLLFSIITSCISLGAICYESNEKRRCIVSVITFIFALVTYCYFDRCFQAFQTSKGVKNVHESRGYYCLLYGLITVALVTFFSNGAKAVEMFSTKSPRTHARAVYAANEEFEFEDIPKDEEFQANFD